MSRSKASGYHLTNHDASIVLGMLSRGDRDHDIAAWFGVNGGRIADVKNGDFGSITAAESSTLPPKGPPGVKGRRLYRYVEDAIKALKEKGADGVAEALATLEDGKAKYDSYEA
jgi:hypothetical protein